ncbi:LOW QUALITY PROTEIN: hypothetical protein Cgig2_010824 [Carnegiea gigantea]|uniref:Uncharacterized protein n=1 Tax=Carnegiea gigantea TaxID=171969 RepID=A0A9Q1GRB2_9CARY|nr:LOW QUALITY PROTEIN: hypothetical protein Cgig2_010824 [Carnegiea gigantea]
MHLAGGSLTVTFTSGITKGRPLGWENDCLDHPTGPRPQETLALSLRSLGSTLPGTNLPEVEGPSRDEELVDAPSEGERLDDPSKEQEDVPPEEELVLRPLRPPAVKNLGRNRDYLEYLRLATRRGISCRMLTWSLPSFKSVIKSAKVISHGYETSCSMLRMLGVDEYSQLDHEGLLHNPHHAFRRESARETQLRSVIHDHAIEDRLHHLSDNLSILCGHAKVKTRAEAVIIHREWVRVKS